MTIWKAILKTVKYCPVNHEFGLLRNGFIDGTMSGGMTEMVQYYTGKLVSDGCVSRRMREWNSGKYDVLAGWIFRWEVVHNGWYRIVCNEPLEKQGEIKNNVEMPISFQPIEGQGGELFLF